MTPPRRDGFVSILDGLEIDAGSKARGRASRDRSQARRIAVGVILGVTVAGVVTALLFLRPPPPSRDQGLVGPSGPRPARR